MGNLKKVDIARFEIYFTLKNSTWNMKPLWKPYC